MTAFQKLIEMPITGRSESYAPADFAERVLPVHPSTPQGRTQLNYATHFSLGGMWGTAYGIAAVAGLRGQRAVNTVFAMLHRRRDPQCRARVVPTYRVVGRGLDRRHRRQVRAGAGHRRHL